MFVALGFALLIELLPVPNHMSSVEIMPMETPTISQIDASQRILVQRHARDNSTGSCCDAMNPVSLACDFLPSHSACTTLYGDSQRVINSDPVVRLIYIEAISPPPKA